MKSRKTEHCIYNFPLKQPINNQKGGTKVLQSKNAHDILLVSAGGKLICPLCGRPTQQRVLPTTTLTDFPLYCKVCRRESVVNVNMSLSQSLCASACAK
jgi:hypothetical protein